MSSGGGHVQDVGSPRDASTEADLLIVGAGAKAAAIATKVHVLNRLGLGPIALTIVEATEPAASWSGRNGMTSGEEPLAIPPIKDVGFPYQSHQEFGEIGEEIDRAMMPFTWQQYMIGQRRYVRWVNAGSPPIQHRTYGKYLAWVLERATEGVKLVRGRVTRVSLDAADEHWRIDVAECTDSPLYRGRALALTGPGVHRPFSHDPDAAPRIFHCDSRRIELARIPIDQSADIAIVGGGESALSCVAFLRAFRADAQLTIYTPSLPMSRGESFLENRVFSNPDEVGWEALDEQTRRDFVRHCDRGVFDPATLETIAYDDQCRFVTGRVTHVSAVGGEDGVCLNYDARGEGDTSVRHDYVVNCTGFDLLEQLRSLFPPAVRAEIESRVGGLWDRPPGNEIPIGRNLELEGMRPRLHIPGLGALSQGPGFANLGCLGLLANRVLQPLLVEPDKRIHASRNPITEVV
ncbi:MAG TPA: SidA/IucD/PvdA family monooxygenase [Solirubrobacteraceae bacterium]|jgi:mycobactin lysine-N-oxygenase|nr:SidA/IucD/PvdA family monooxygenase [Solirubrobacteraceae bacterium]